MADINSTLILMEPLTNQVQNIAMLISSIIGGLVGLTIIMIALRIYEIKQIKKFRHELKEDFNSLRKRLDEIEKKLSKRK